MRVSRLRKKYLAKNEQHLRGKTLNRLFEWRQKADCEAFLETNEEMTKNIFQQSKKLLEICAIRLNVK